MTSVTTSSVINHIAAVPPRTGHRISFVRLGGTVSLDLADLHERAGRLAWHLAELGVRAGDRIGILAANSLEWVLLDLAALRLKAVTAGFDPGKFQPEPALLTRYDLAYLFTDRNAAAPGILPMAGLAELGPGGGLPVVDYAPGDATTIKFTSGSTGEPKGLAATAGSIDASILAVQEMFGHGDGDDLFVFLPLSLLQQRYWIYSALRFGHDVTVTTYEAAFPTLRKARPTVVMGVPGFYETARRHIEAQRTDPKTAATRLFGDRIRYLWTGSAPASPGLLEFFDGLGLPIYEGYGLNETCIVAKNHPGAHRRGSVGQVLPGKKVLFDADGVISVRSDHPVNTRYAYAAPGESGRVFGPDGTVRTGDVGHLDADGFLYIHGRADDVIVLDNGRKVVVRPIEERLKASQAIEECVVFCPTQTHLAAVISPAADPPDSAAIAAHVAACNAELGPDEQIAHHVVASPRFSIEGGLLTSQYKPRRAQILRAYRDALAPQGRQP
jgi:long-subunit acyl-CoA synthetase (AMP-forming)